MTNKALSIFNQLRPVTIGFDNVFDHFERMMDGDQIFSSGGVNYPPYNIVKTGENTHDIEVALAGFSKKDIDIEYKNNMLTIKSTKESISNKADGVVHRGISQRYFSKSFTIADDVEVKGAELKDGLLTVSLERIIPESKKAKKIDIK
jgi:molecular chaperone IbpA